jgi:diguanylate cyclase (GGDEF)-like protein
MKLSIPHRLLDFLTPNNLFSRLNLKDKMILGYMVLVVFTIVMVTFALISLQRLNSMNKSIITVDIRVQEASEQMLEAILAQDNYEKRYLILKGNSDLFWRRGQEFDQWFAVLSSLPDREDLRLKKIKTLYRQYCDLFAKEINLLKHGDAAKAIALSNGQLKNKWTQLFKAIKAMSADAKASEAIKIERVGEIGSFAFFTTALLCAFSIIIGSLAGIIVTRHICSSIHKLSVATEHIAKGHFDYDPQIKTKDEVGNLAESFLSMGKRLQQLEEMSLDANALTRLPGGIAIENVLKKRLESKQPIAFCVLDMDNFKAFNDRYGYAHGSEVIKETARIIENAVKNKGFHDDFVGHVGGDDFVVITTPKYMHNICSEIVSQFDQRIPGFYDQTDREKGYILGNNRLGEEIRFPIMTMSIAIVTNVQRSLNSPLEVSEIAAELKEYAKTIAGSVYVVDKRRSAVCSIRMPDNLKVAEQTLI